MKKNKFIKYLVAQIKLTSIQKTMAAMLYGENGFDNANEFIKRQIEIYDKGKKKTITVCDKCLRACCWQGKFMCDEAIEAGTVEKTIKELKKLRLEHPDYWEK